MARSMLSFGTEVFFAFCTASTRVGLPERSAPPIFAATSMFLMSLANDLARRESMIAFLCLVVAHLEWPDIPPVYRSALSTHDLLERPQIAAGRRLLIRPSREQLAERGIHRRALDRIPIHDPGS